MKKIVDYRKLLGVNKNATLSELKTIYRNFMKEHHPDKFQDDHEHKSASEEKSKKIIEAYHFLVSIAPETVVQNREQYIKTTTTSAIVDFTYKAQTLEIHFEDGSGYEYFDVPHNTYSKLCNSESQGRFARRHIYNEFVYRNIKRIETE